MPPSSDSGPAEARVGPGPARYHAVRLVLAAVVGAYMRTSVAGRGNIPAGGPYIICFNHPSWLDPVVLAATWPDPRRRLFVFGPREQDMSRGWRNHLITWTGRGVHFKPHSQDVLDVTRRAVAVLRGGDCLAVAGEGRLSDHEGRILPLQTGLAHFSRLGGAPILPTAIVGTRWVHLGCRVRVEIGEPVYASDFGPGRVGAQGMTREVEVRLQALLEGVVDSPRPRGRFGRWFSEAFNERPWLDADTPPLDGGPDARPGADAPPRA